MWERRLSRILRRPLRWSRLRRRDGPAAVGDSRTPLSPTSHVGVSPTPRKLDRFTSGYNPALSASPDGTTILYHKVVSDGADLMLIENFR